MELTKIASTSVTTSLFDLSGKNIVITGGAGHLGSEISLGLASFGAVVYALGRDSIKLASLKSRADAIGLENLIVKELDVNNHEAFLAFLQDEIIREGKSLDILVNNANSSGREKWENLDIDIWREALKGSLEHYFTCAKAASKVFLTQGYGNIVNTASLFSFMAPYFPMHLELGNAASAHHVVAKGGVLQLTKYLATLWAAKGIRVNCVSPGYFPKKRGPDNPKYMQEVCDRIPMGRIGMANEIVGVYVFLCSSASSYMTGQNLIVDGGYSVW